MRTKKKKKGRIKKRSRIRRGGLNGLGSPPETHTRKARETIQGALARTKEAMADIQSGNCGRAFFELRGAYDNLGYAEAHGDSAVEGASLKSPVYRRARVAADEAARAFESACIVKRG